MRTCMLFLLMSILGILPPTYGQSGYVIDSAHLFAPNERAALVRALEEYALKGGSRLVAVGIDSLPPHQEMGSETRKWLNALGGHESDSVVVVLLVKAEKKACIYATSAIQDPLDEATCVRIVQEDMSPLLAKGMFYASASAGTTKIMAVLDHEFSWELDPVVCLAVLVGTMALGLVVGSIAYRHRYGRRRGILGKFLTELTTGKSPPW